MSLKTDDVGYAIKDALALLDCIIDYDCDEHSIVGFDISDPNNLIVSFDNGQQFTVRIIAI